MRWLRLSTAALIRVVLVLATLGLSNLRTAAAEGICNREYVEYYEDLGKAVKKSFGAIKDVNPHRMAIVVISDGLYVQSNYIPDGHEYPTKLVLDKTQLSLDAIVARVIAGAGAGGFLPSAGEVSAFLNGCTLRLDEHVIGHPRWRYFRFAAVSKVLLIQSKLTARFFADGEEERRYVELMPSLLMPFEQRTSTAAFRSELEGIRMEPLAGVAVLFSNKRTQVRHEALYARLQVGTCRWAWLRHPVQLTGDDQSTQGC